ncbi:hypothetical protein D6C86_10382, partial [Aureobasidium pullulans]
QRGGPSSGVIDPRRVFGGSSRHEKTLYETRHRKNVAIDMLLMINESTRKETALYYYATIFARGEYSEMSEERREHNDLYKVVC